MSFFRHLLKSFLFREFHFLFNRQNGGEIKVYSTFPSTEARRHERLVNSQVSHFEDQDKGMTLKNGHEIETEQTISGLIVKSMMWKITK